MSIKLRKQIFFIIIVLLVITMMMRFLKKVAVFLKKIFQAKDKKAKGISINQI